jgi:D-alanyl-D-alanine dipeptidase
MIEIPLWLTLLAASPLAGPPLIDATDAVPGLVVDMRYASENNFLKRKVYPISKCLLRRPVAERLARVQNRLRQQGLGLKVFDCYRPISIQRAMWQIKPVKGYVADPSTGSNHNRGAAVDVGLVDAEGRPVSMPTDFDAFVHAAHQGAAVPGPLAKNRDTLKAAMEAEGFRSIRMEWWHFDAPDPGAFPVLDLPLSGSKDGPDQSGSPPPLPSGAPASNDPASDPASSGAMKPASSK